MAVENALLPECRVSSGTWAGHYKPPNDIARLMRNIILGAEFVMSSITHFYTLAALSYVQGPAIPPWTPYFDDSYYAGVLLRPDGDKGATGNPVYQFIHAASGMTARAVPASGKLAINGYTGIDGIWDNVVLDYVTALKYRRDAANVSALLGGRTPQIQNGCVVGGAAHKPTSADLAMASSTVDGLIGFLRDHQIPLTHIVSYLYGRDYGGLESGAGGTVRDYDNDGSDPMTGKGAGAATGIGANRVLAWGVFDENLSGDPTTRLLPRGSYEWNGSTMGQVAAPEDMWSNLYEYTDSSRYAAGTAKHPSAGVTNPEAANGYSWAKSPRMNGKACQVGPLARMAVRGRTNPGVTSPEYYSYEINTNKPQHIVDLTSDTAPYAHPYLNKILRLNLDTVAAAYGDPTPLVAAGFRCGFSTMDRHRARAYEALKIANRIKDWCTELTTYMGSNPTESAWTSWDGITATTAANGYGAHEAPRGALAHFVEITNGKISNYQAVVPTTWNVNPKTTTTTPAQNGPIESAIIGIDVTDVASATHKVSVEAMRVVQGFDPCIACTVH